MAMMSVMKLYLVGVAMCLGAEGHGYMFQPASRNSVFGGGDAPSGNGQGSENTCGENGQWPNSDGLSELNGRFTTDLTHYQEGQVIDVGIRWTAAHQGHFVMELCANPEAIIKQDCFVRLARDPSDVRYGPMSVAHPDYVILPENRCMLAWADTFHRFRLPTGVKTEHGILRWYWQTGNSCASAPETQAGNSFNLGTTSMGGLTCSVPVYWGDLCGDDCPHPDCSFEQFRSCADISIGSGGAVPGTTLPPPAGNTTKSTTSTSTTTSSTTTTTHKPVVPTVTEGVSGYCSECECLEDAKPFEPPGWCQATCRDPKVVAWCESIGKPNVPLCITTWPGWVGNCILNSAPPTTTEAVKPSSAPSVRPCSECRPKPGMEDYGTWCVDFCQSSGKCNKENDKPACMARLYPDFCAA